MTEVAAHSSNIDVTIVGTGAMACLLGARLASVARVTLTGSWPEGIAAIRSSGITVDDVPEPVAVPVAAVAWHETIPPADLVLVLVKSWQTHRVARRLHNLLKSQGVALTLQNGLGNLETLGCRACLGVTYQGATLLGPGRVRPGGTGPTVIAGPAWVVDMFVKAGMQAGPGLPEHLDALLWGKLVVNCGINAVTALLRIPNGELLCRPDALCVMEQAACECAGVAHAKGIVLPFSDPAAKARDVAAATAVNHSSMLQDVQRGAPTECEAINGAVVSWGERLDVATPVNAILLRLMRALGPIVPDEDRT